MSAVNPTFQSSSYTRQFVVGPEGSGFSNVGTQGVYAKFTTSPTLVFAPLRSGLFRVAASVPVFLAGATALNDVVFVSVYCSAGSPSPTITRKEEYKLQPADLNDHTVTPWTVFSLTAGISYSFDLQGLVSGVDTQVWLDDLSTIVGSAANHNVITVEELG